MQRRKSTVTNAKLSDELVWRIKEYITNDQWSPRQISCAFVQIYFPEGVLLRLISRESVDWLIPTMSAISFLAVFFWSMAKNCDLCSEINWWYICNTKLVNLGETSVSFFYLYCWLFLFPLREMQTTSRYASRTSASLGEGHSFIALRFGTCKGSTDMLELNFSMLPLHLHLPSALLRHLLYSFIYV